MRLSGQHEIACAIAALRSVHSLLKNKPSSPLLLCGYLTLSDISW